MLHWGGNDHGVHVCAVEKLLRLCHALDVRIQRADMFQALRIEVADGFEPAVRKTFEVANKKRSPVTASDNTDCDFLLHTFRADSVRRCRVGAGERSGSSWRSGLADDRDSKSCPAITAQVLRMIFRSSRKDRFFK